MVDSAHQSQTRRTLVTRPATPDDADHLARLINYAGEGMPYHVWQKNAEAGMDPWEFGRIRARRSEGAFTYRNAVIAEVEGDVAACLITYPLAGTPEPIDYDTMPAMFVPLQELENLAPGTQYVNVLATHPERRSMGCGTHLLAEAERMAGGRAMSIIVSDGNTGARRLYEKTGYVETDARPIVKEDGWDCDGENWVLLVKRDSR
ncbi:GNAT family N-acetyltransferase [Hoeflea sp. CAU 1731]